MKNLSTKFSIVAITTCLLLNGLTANAAFWNKEPKSTKEQIEEVFSAGVPIPEGILSESSFKISAIDPKLGVAKNGDFHPGGRGANQLVIYTHRNGARTGTNEFGAEAIVVNGTVVRISGADSIIPKGGYVISGHGKAKNWMNLNLTVGTKIHIDYKSMTITAYLTNDSFIYATKEKIKEIDQMMRY